MLAKSPSVLLTLDDVRSWKRQREVMVMQMADLERKLKAVAIFLSEEDRLEIFGVSDIPGAPKARDDQAAIGKFVIEVLEREGRGMSAAELTELSRHSELADFVSQNPTAIEDTVLRYSRHGKVKKRGQVFYHPFAMEQAPKQVRDGKDVDHFRSLIVQSVRRKKDGLTSAEAIDILKADPAGRVRLSSNPQYPYSLLGRMVDKGQIVKKGGRFYPVGTNEKLPETATAISPSDETAAA